MLRPEGPSPPSFPAGLLCLPFPFFLKSIHSPMDGWRDMMHLYGNDGLLAVVRSGKHPCPRHVCPSVEWGPPRWQDSSMCPAGPPCPGPRCLGACMCAQRVCCLRSCGRAGARRCGPSGQGFKGRVLCPEPIPGPGTPQAWDPPGLGPHAIPADISPYPGRARPQFSVLLSVVVGERGCLILWCGAWAPACPLQVPSWPSRARNFPNSSIAAATWCWDRQGLSPSGLPR